MDTLLAMNGAIMSIDTNVTYGILSHVMNSTPWPLELIKELILLIVPILLGYFIANFSRDKEVKSNIELKKVELFNDNVKDEIKDLKNFRQKYKLILDDFRLLPHPAKETWDDFKSDYVAGIRSNIKKINELKREYIGVVNDEIIEKIDEIIDDAEELNWDEADLESRVKGGIEIGDWEQIDSYISEKYADRFVSEINDVTKTIDKLIVGKQSLIHSYRG